MICQVSLFSRFLLLLNIPQTKQSSVTSTRLFFRLGKDQKSPSVVPVDFTEVGNIEVEVSKDGLESESIVDSGNVTEASDDPAASPQESLDLVDSGDITEINGTEVDWDPLAQEVTLDQESLNDLTTDKESLAATQKVLDSNEEPVDAVATGADGANGADGADGADAVVPPELVAEDIPDSAIDGDDTPTEDTTDLEEGDDETIVEESVVGEEGDNPEVVNENLEVVNENPDAEEVAEGIDETGDEDIEEIFVETPDLLSEITGGLGTVTDPSGKLSIIWKFDGGAYEGQIGVVSTTGMENYDLNSIEFMQEAIRRALANIVVDDTLNGAEFGGWMNGEDSNHGEFTGVQTVQLSAGEQFFLALIPNGTFADVLTGLESGEIPTGSTRPLFSLATANPENTNHFVQLVDLTGKGNLFALEDIRGDEKSDWDLNDIILTIKGAEVDAASLDDLIERGEISEVPKWMEGELGKAILESAIDDLWIESENLVSEKYDFPKEDQPLIGFIDTHFTANNPDLDPSRITFGGDYIENDSNPMVTVGEGTHGDHVLGIVGATQDNGIGIDGINDDAPLWVSSAVGSGKWEETLTSFVEAVKASGQPTGVINLSIDLTQINSDGSITTRYEFTPAERAALELARQNDILIVVSIGNEAGVPSVLGQASQEFHNIITVGAAQEVTLPDGTVSYARADYSNYGDTLDIVAPGGTAANPVVSTVGDGIGKMAGTSVATAKVTGAASLIRVANPELNAMQVIEILKKSATDINTPGWDVETGAGLLNIAAAVSLGRITQGEEYKPIQKDMPLVWGETGKPQERAAANATIKATNNAFNERPNSISGINNDGSLVQYNSDAGTYVYNSLTDKKELFPTSQFSADGNTYSRIENGSLFLYNRIANTRTLVAQKPSDKKYLFSSMSENGKYIIYYSYQNANGTTDYGRPNVYVYDVVTGTTTIDTKLSDFVYSHDWNWYTLSMSDDGSKATFTSNEVINGKRSPQVFFYDRNTGVIKQLTSSGTNDNNQNTVISADGKFIAFTSGDTTLVPNDKNQARDAFVYETATGNVKKVSVGINNAEANGDSYISDISADGRYVLFISDATNLVVSNTLTSKRNNIFVYDTLTGENTLVNIDENNQKTAYQIYLNSSTKISGDGKQVAFMTDAIDAATGQFGSTLFVRAWQPQDTVTVGSVDLAGQSFDIPNGAIAGDTINAQFQLSNNGNAATKPFRAGFYISQDSNISTADKFLGFQTVDSVIANGSTSSLSIPLILPPANDPFWNGTGKYYVGMIADDTGTITETNEANNANQGINVDLKEINITVPVAGDLVNNGISISKSAMNAGEDFRTFLQVANNAVNSMDNFRVGFYISKSPNITQNDKLLGTQEIATLAGNANLIVPSDLKLPNYADSFWNGSGTYYIGAIIDDQDKINESVETNNVMATPFTYKGLVDLAGSYFNIADSNKIIGNLQYFDAGDTIETQFQVNNNGSGQTAPVKVSFYISEEDRYRPTDPIIGSYIINSIAGNSNSGLITQNIQLPTNLAVYGLKQQGAYKIGMIIDSDNSVQEINEFNNVNLGTGIDSKDILIMTGNLRLPDLTGNIVSAPTSLKPGDSFNLQYTLSNSGGGAASSFQPNFYLVDLNNPDGGFQLKELSKIPAISLLSNSSSGVQNIQLTLPEIGAAFWQGGSGNYAIQMVADSLDQVTEFNERNNETNYPVQINYIPIFGTFLDKWRQNPSLGLPTAVVKDTGNGTKTQYFANGHIYSDNTGVYVYKTGGAGQGNAKPVDPAYQEKIVPGVTTGISNSGRWIYNGYLGNATQDNLTFKVDKTTNIEFSIDSGNATLSLFRGKASNGAFVTTVARRADGTYYGSAKLEPGEYTLSTWTQNTSTNYKIVTNFNNQPTSVETGRRTISIRSSLPNQGQQINVPVIPLPSSQNIKENWGFLYGRREFQTYYSNGVGSPDWFEFQVDSLTNPKDMHTLQFALRNGNDLDIPNAKIEIVDTNGRVLNVDRPGEVPIAVLPNGKYYVKVTPSQAGIGYKVVMNLDSAKDELLDARDLGKLSGRATFHDFVGSSGDAFGDTYRFQVEKDSFVRFKVNTKDAGGDADITLMNSSGQVLVQGNGDNYGERQLGAGTYFLKVEPTLGRTNYELVTQVAEILGEMYGRREEFPGKSISSGYADAFYSFNLAKQTDLSMALKNLSADVDFELRLDNGTGLINSDFIASNDGVDQFGVANELKYYRDLAAGKYFVRVINKNNVSSAKYDLVLNGSSNITQENIGLLNGRKEYSAYVGNASSQRSYTFTVEQAMKVKFSLNKPGNNSSDSMLNGNLKLINADTGVDVNLVNPKEDGSINYAEAELKPGINYKLIVTPSGGGTNYKLVVDPVFPVISPANVNSLNKTQDLDYFRNRPQFYTTENIFHKDGWGSNLLGGGWRSNNNSGKGTEGNCTWYAYGRVKELGGDVNALNSMRGNANQWHTQLSNGSQIVSDPQFGDIAQWTSNGQNHVAVVEKVYYENGVKRVVLSESQYTPNYDGGGIGTLHRIVDYTADNPDRYIRVPGIKVASGGGSQNGDNNVDDDEYLDYYIEDDKGENVKDWARDRKFNAVVDHIKNYAPEYIKGLAEEALNDIVNDLESILEEIKKFPHVNWDKILSDIFDFIVIKVLSKTPQGRAILAAMQLVGIDKPPSEILKELWDLGSNPSKLLNLISNTGQNIWNFISEPAKALEQTKQLVENAANAIQEIWNTIDIFRKGVENLPNKVDNVENERDLDTLGEEFVEKNTGPFLSLLANLIIGTVKSKVVKPHWSSKLKSTKRSNRTKKILKSDFLRLKKVSKTYDGKSYDYELEIPASDFSDYVTHVAIAQKNGRPAVLTIDRDEQRKKQRRKEALEKYKNRQKEQGQVGDYGATGMDMDEYPPAMFAEGGNNSTIPASVMPMDQGKNRSAGRVIGYKLRDLPNGARVRIITTFE